MLRAWANLNGLDCIEVESIEELRIADIRRIASYGKGDRWRVRAMYTSGTSIAATCRTGGSLPKIAEVRTAVSTATDEPSLS